MSTTSNRILSIYKSRNTLLEQLNYQDYNVYEYNEFSINEIDAMHNNEQLDMLINHDTNNKKVYIKHYFTSKQIKPQNLDDIIEDLFTIENGLTTLSMRPNSPMVCISVLAVSLLSEVFIPLVFVFIGE
jgi:hypothetical protein